MFACVGAATTVFDLASYAALVELAGWTPAAANVFSYSAATCLSFFLNRNITFKEPTYRHRQHHQFLRFAIVNLAALTLSTGLIYVLAQLTGPLLAKLASMPVTFAFGFLCSRRFVFATPKKSAETSASPQA